MLQRVLELRRPFEAILRSERSLTKYFIADAEWRFLEEMGSFLKPFESVTLLLSKSKQPTAAIYIKLFNHLESCTAPRVTNGIIIAAEAACSKLNKYYTMTDALVYVVGLILDPRCKLQWYKSVKIEETVIKSNKKAAIAHWKKLYKPAESAPEAPTVNSGLDLVASQMMDMNTEKLDEFQTYLALPAADPNKVTDVLKWRRDNEASFPCLSRMARDYLGVSGTGVPIERAFCYGSDLLQPKTLSSSGDTIRKRFCLKAWLKYKNGKFYTVKMKEIAKTMTGCH